MSLNFKYLKLTKMDVTRFAMKLLKWKHRFVWGTFIHLTINTDLAQASSDWQIVAIDGVSARQKQN